MANTPSGIYYPLAGAANDPPADFLAMANTLEGSTIPSLADITTRNSVKDSMTTAQKRGAVFHVANQGWFGWDGAAWQDFDNNKIKKGRVDAVVESNGNARIAAADCFFNGVAPSVVLCFSVMGPTFTFAWSLNDGGGSLIKGYDHNGNGGAGAYVDAGASVAFFWIAVR